MAPAEAMKSSIAKHWRSSKLSEAIHNLVKKLKKLVKPTELGTIKG